MSSRKMLSSVDTNRRKRPITEAFLHAEASYGRVKRRIKTMSKEIRAFRSALCENAPRSIETHIQLLEEDVRRHYKELVMLEEQYKCSKAEIYLFIKEKLDLHQKFLCFLLGFRDSGLCLLPMLDQGHETTTSIKGVIADFAGVPTGKVLGDICELERLIRHTQDQVKDDP
jgi:hypothetical protein